MKDQFFTSNTELNEAQIDELVRMLTSRCNHKTKVRIRSMVTYDLPTLVNKVSWFNRFYINADEVHYCAGQSYPCELKAIRQEIMKKYP